jgi:hypothetical protein
VDITAPPFFLHGLQHEDESNFVPEGAGLQAPSTLARKTAFTFSENKNPREDPVAF